MKAFLTKPETAALIRVHPDTIQAMMDRGDLQGFQSGRITRVSAASVEALIGCRLEEAAQPDSTEPDGKTPEDDGANGLTGIEPENHVLGASDPEDALEPGALAVPRWGDQH